MIRVPSSAPSAAIADAEELADLIGPISTRKDRARVIAAWIARQADKKDSDSKTVPTWNTTLTL